MKLRTLSHFLVPGMLLFAWHQSPGQVLRMSTEELVDESSAIVVGTCKEKKSFWNEQRDKIFTEVRIQASEYLKGDLGGDAIITVPGGRVGNTIYEVSDMPVFELGEEAVVFVWQHPSGKNLVTGAEQGKLRIETDRITKKKSIRMTVPGSAVVDEFRLFKGDERRAARQLPLDEYIKAVREFLRE